MHGAFQKELRKTTGNGRCGTSKFRQRRILVSIKIIAEEKNMLLFLKL